MRGMKIEQRDLCTRPVLLFGLLLLAACSTPMPQPAVPVEPPAAVESPRAAEPVTRLASDLAVSFDNHEWDLRTIFRDVKADNPDIKSGRFTLVVVIESSGVVSAVEIHSEEFAGAPFLETMREAVFRWRFPPGNYVRMQVSNSFELN